MRSVQPVHAVFREKQVVVALLKVMQIAHIRIQLAQKPLRQADLRVGNRRR